MWFDSQTFPLFNPKKKKKQMKEMKNKEQNERENQDTHSTDPYQKSKRKFNIGFNYVTKKNVKVVDKVEWQ